MTTQPKILILGGGAIGLATAIELAENGADVTVLNHAPKSAALYAAAGMLAPQAEKIDNSDFFEFCRQSRDLYPQWARHIEALSGISCGYWSCGILAPQYSSQKLTSDSKASRTGTAEQKWLDSPEIHRFASYLSPSVFGGWLYPKDAQVNNRQLGQALNLAADAVGVHVHHDITINRLVTKGDRIDRIKTQNGDWTADHYLLATGAWTGMLEDVPVIPRKGQLLSVTPMDGCSSINLQQVLYGEEIYIVPRRTGEIVIGATSEDVGFTPGNTVGGVQHLLCAATRLVPQLNQYELYQQWWGFRPTTPDELPILGESPWENLTIATGHYRNGILLTPLTAKLMGQFILNGNEAPELSLFRWDRFNLPPRSAHASPCVPCSSGIS